jgi:hypothetical protein
MANKKGDEAWLKKIKISYIKKRFPQERWRSGPLGRRR